MSEPDRNQQQDDGWREQLQSLGDTPRVSRESQDRAVSALTRAGILRKTPVITQLGRVLLPLAAGLLLFLAGAWWERNSPARAIAADSPRFAIFLLEDSTFRGTPAGHDSLVAEYSAWARGLGERGQLVLGEELGAESWTLGSPAGVAEVPHITGLFVVSAENSEAALTIAKSCPHLRYGGGLIVRPIQPT